MKRIYKYVDDILIFAGLALIAGTTFSINMKAGFYVTGAELFSLGLLFAFFPVRRNKK